MTANAPRLTDPTAAWVDPATGKPTTAFFQYMNALDRIARASQLQGSVVLFAALPAGSAGDQRFVSNGRKAGESAGTGTGVLAYFDGTNWIASDTGATLAA